MNFSKRTVGKVLAVIVAPILLWVGRITWDYFDPDSPATPTMQVQLKMFGTAMYDHSRTGHWPTSVDDLAQTSLPARSPVWRKNREPLSEPDLANQGACGKANPKSYPKKLLWLKAR